MYFDEAAEPAATPQAAITQANVLLALNAALLLGLGLFPDALIWLCAKVVYYTVGL